MKIKGIQNIGLSLVLLAFAGWIGLLFMNNYKLTSSIISSEIEESASYQEVLKPIIDKPYDSVFGFVKEANTLINEFNSEKDSEKEYDQKLDAGKVISLTKASASGYLVENPGKLGTIVLLLLLAGCALYFFPELGKSAGIKNDGIWESAATSAKWLGLIMAAIMVGFYIALYFYPAYLANWLLVLDPLSNTLNGGNASQWFLYGVLYTVAVVVMGVRMLIKYRHNNYQMIRTGSVMFFQLIFAFLIPEILSKLNMASADLKNMWPLDYTFFFDYRIDEKIQAGSFGIFLLVWGIALFSLGVPILTYFYGKRWYCSWVCGCGGLAETLGDPFRQLSSKKLKAWQIERYLIHFVLVFAVVMTAGVLYTYFTGNSSLFGLTDSGTLRYYYGFAIGSIFSGVVGTGFYPIMGNRVWCRFGCPLAAYLGLVQRFKSRFRITTNGGQCISCGNCSTYCEQGIDVRWYAQRGQDIVRSSCVGCGICSAVCPRGVLNLENGPAETRNI